MPRGNAIFEFLLRNVHATRHPEEWCRLMGVEIVDPDGWRGKNGRPFNEGIKLPEFISRIAQSTIVPAEQ